jgi:hypothetical protein
LKEIEMHAQVEKEHEWLQKFVGEWSYESEATMEPGQPPLKFTGTETVRSIGGIWILAEGRGEMPGGAAATMILTLGFDPQKKHFVGTWLGSMMTYLWTYQGSLDAARNVLTLDSEGPNCAADGKLATFKETIEFKSDDHRVFTSSMLTDDGKWTTLMTAHYRRSQ